MNIRQRGFTLIEIAISLIILGIVLGGIVIPITETFKNAQIRNNSSRLNEVREAIFGFAIQNQRLPCPARQWTDGEEYCDWQVTSSATPSNTNDGVLRGFIPWQTLGVSREDAFGAGVFYVVNQKLTIQRFFTELANNNSSLQPISICGRDDNNLSSTINYGNNIAVVFGSFGRKNINFNSSNGSLFNVSNGSVIPNFPTTLLADEKENIKNCCESLPSSRIEGNQPDRNICAPTTIHNFRFWHRTYFDRADPIYGSYDDQIIWIPWYQLVGVMTQAGRLQ